MKIRLMGTMGEVALATERLTEVFDVLEISDFRPNRGASRLGRIYVEVAPPTPNRVQATATRTDNPLRKVVDPHRIRRLS